MAVQQRRKDDLKILLSQVMGYQNFGCIPNFRRLVVTWLPVGQVPTGAAAVGDVLPTEKICILCENLKYVPEV